MITCGVNMHDTQTPAKPSIAASMLEANSVCTADAGARTQITALSHTLLIKPPMNSFFVKTRGVANVLQRSSRVSIVTALLESCSITSAIKVP